MTLDQTWSNKVSISAIDRTSRSTAIRSKSCSPWPPGCGKGRSVHRGPLSAFYWFDSTPAPFPPPIRRLPMRGRFFTDGGNTISGRLGFPQPGMFGQSWPALIQGTYVDGNNKRPSRNGQGWPLRRFRQL